MKSHKFYAIREKNGRYTRRTSWKAVVAGITFLSIGIAYINHAYAAGSTSNVGGGMDEQQVTGSGTRKQAIGAQNLESDCLKQDNGEYDCTDPQTLKDWFDHEAWNATQHDAKLPLSILNQVCVDNGIFTTDCPKHLYGMAVQESRMGKYMIGDNGKSHGYFHIMYYHKVSVSCEEDLYCSANWSLKRMISKGYKTDPDTAIMAHNGTPHTPNTEMYLQMVKKYMPS